MLAPASRGGGPSGNAIAELLIVTVTCAALIAYPLLPIVGRQAILVGFAWAVVIPVTVGLRRSPRPLRLPWRLLLAAMVIGALGNTVRRLPTCAMQAPFLDAAASIAVTASIGSIVSEAADRGTVTAEDPIEQADAAMYAHKASMRIRPGPAPATD